MQHARLFRKLREQRGLTLDALAALARRHRNTIINLENGRPVKFATIAQLMDKMGFAGDSREMADMALLWVEAISGVQVTAPGDTPGAKRRLESYRRDAQQHVLALIEVIRIARLGEREVRLLAFAARHPAVMEIIGSVHDLLATARTDKPELRVAEDK